MSQIFIPEKIRVGFQKRANTYTGKLGYVIYYDEKGNIRKENSWKSWCDAKEGVLELDNTPRSGYILNKGVQRHGHFGSGRSVIRMYDPRDFEFEISVDNLVAIFMHSNVSKRDIEEECVFAWAGTELILLPVVSEEYQQAKAYTAKQSKTLSTKDFVAGHIYHAKKEEDPLVYIGYHEWFSESYERDSNGRYKSITKSRGKKHIFYNAKRSWHTFSAMTPAQLSEHIETVSPDYQSALKKFANSKESGGKFKVS